MITILDYGLGNIGSIMNVLNRMNIKFRTAHLAEDIITAEKLILPGVGSFDKGMHRLNDLALIEPLEKAVIDNKIPTLGICLGMQLFMESSEEGHSAGLGWIKGKVVKFRIPKDETVFKVPHMGWNSINVKGAPPILYGLNENDRFYFVHSYHVDEMKPENIIGRTEYTYEFPSVIQQENIIGIQCHPERSHGSGMKIIKNFVSM